jgi:vacuolar-type H+-ATPase subunit E/Vma4
MSTGAGILTRGPAGGARDRSVTQATALETLKAELIRQAELDATDRLQRAAAEDAATIADAEQEAALIVEQARQDGIVDASGSVAAQRIRGRRQAREVTLRARAEALDELCSRSMAAVARLSTEPDYPTLRERVADYVRAQLGEQAVISEAPIGGVIGTVPGQRLDCSFAALLEQAIAERAARSDRSWTT